MEPALPSLDPALIQEFNAELLNAMIIAVRTLRNVMTDAPNAASAPPHSDASDRLLPARLAAAAVLRTRFLKLPGVDAPELVRATPSTAAPPTDTSPSPAPTTHPSASRASPSPTPRSHPVPRHPRTPESPPPVPLTASFAPSRSIRPNPVASLLARAEHPSGTITPFASPNHDSS